MNTQVWVKRRIKSGVVQAVNLINHEDVHPFVVQHLKDGSGNKSLTIESNFGVLEQWTYEWVEVML